MEAGDVRISLYLMEVMEEDSEKRKKALQKIIADGDFIFLKEEYRNLLKTVDSEKLNEKLFNNNSWLYMIYFKGGYKRLFSLLDANYSYKHTDLVKLWENNGHLDESQEIVNVQTLGKKIIFNFDYSFGMDIK